MHPKIFTIPIGGGIPIHSYGVMLGISFIVAWVFTGRMAIKDKLPPDKVGTLFIVTAVAAVAGSRLLFVLTNMDSVGIGQVPHPIDLRRLRHRGLHGIRQQLCHWASRQYGFRSGTLVRSGDFRVLEQRRRIFASYGDVKETAGTPAGPISRGSSPASGPGTRAGDGPGHAL